MTLMARRVVLLLGSSALTAIIGAGTASAQEGQSTTAEQSATIRLQTIVVETTADAATPEEVPASVDTIGEGRIQTFGRGKLDDVLRSTPGTFTRENPQQPGVAVNIRGFEGSGRVNSTIDGVRQSFRFTGHEASGFTYVDPNFLSSIDVRRGAVSTAGGGGLAGSVNFRTIGVDDIVPEGKEYGVLGRMRWGENGSDFSQMLATGYRGESAGFALGVGGRNAGDFKNGDGEVEPFTGQDLKSGLVKAEYDFGDGHHLSFGGLYYHNDFTANSYQQRIVNRTATLGYRYAPSDNDLVDLSINAYYNNTDMTYDAPADPSSPFASAVGRKIRDRGTGVDVSNVSNFTIGDIEWRSENGFEYFRDKVTSINGGVNPADGTATNSAAFTENTFTYGNFDVIAALRYDHYKLEGAANAGGAIGEYVVDQSKGRVNPRVTLAMHATDWLQPYVTWSESMRAPTIQEAMTGGDHPGGTSASFLPNPNLRPERQRGWEVGANVQRDDVFTAGDSLRAKVSYYDMNIRDYIAARPHPTLGQYWYTNLDGTSHQRGIELGGSYDAGRVFGDLTYTHTHSQLPAQQEGLGALNELPDDIVSLTVGGRFLDRRLETGGRVNYVSNGVSTDYMSAPDPDGGPATQKTPSYTLVDLFASYQVGSDSELALQVTNVFDRAYTPSLSTTGSGRGRTVWLSAQFRF